MAAASVAESSTLRCLLADDLGIQLRRVGPGIRMTLVEGEQPLSSLMAENGRSGRCGYHG